MRNILRKSQNSQNQSPYLIKSSLLKQLHTPYPRKSLGCTQTKFHLPKICHSPTVDEILASPAYLHLLGEFQAMQVKHRCSMMKLREFEKTKASECRELSKGVFGVRTEVGELKKRVYCLEEQIEEEKNYFDELEIQYVQNQEEGERQNGGEHDGDHNKQENSPQEDRSEPEEIQMQSMECYNNPFDQNNQLS